MNKTSLSKCQHRYTAAAGGIRAWSYSPVNGGDGGILREARRMGIVLTPNRAANEVSIVRRFEIVVNGRDHGQDPRKQSQDLVGGDGCRTMRFPLREGVDLEN